MNIFRFYISFLLFGLLLTWGSHSYGKENLRLGYVPLNPLLFDENGKFHGSVARVIKKALKSGGLNYKSFQIPNKRVSQYLQEQKLDISIVIKSFVPNPDDYYFSSSPVTHLKLVATGIQNYPVNSVDDLNKHSIIVLAGFTYGGVFDGAGSSNLNIAASVTDHFTAVDALLYGRGELFLGYQRSTNEALKRYPKRDFYQYHLSDIPLYVVVRKDLEESSALIHLINSHIEN